MRLQATVDDRAVREHLRSVPNVIRAHVIRRLEYWGRRVVTETKRDLAGKFTYSSPPPQGHQRGALANSLWTERKRSESVPTQAAGWGVPYGEFLEFGPRRKKRWIIRPKGFRSDVKLGRSGAGQALQFLRFEVGGVIKYARQVEHKWTKRELRKHFGPALKKLRAGINRDLSTIPNRVVRGKLR